MDEAATGSVGETSAPRTNAAAHGSPTTQCATAATVTVVSSTSPIARDDIGHRFALRSRGEEKKADEYRSGGRKISSMRFGGNWMVGTAGMRLRASPPKDQENRVGHPEVVGEQHESCHGHEQPEDPELQMPRHRAIFPGKPLTDPASSPP